MNRKEYEKELRRIEATHPQGYAAIVRHVGPPPYPPVGFPKFQVMDNLATLERVCTIYEQRVAEHGVEYVEFALMLHAVTKGR